MYTVCDYHDDQRKGQTVTSEFERLSSMLLLNLKEASINNAFCPMGTSTGRENNIIIKLQIKDFVSKSHTDFFVFIFTSVQCFCVSVIH